MNLRSSPYRSTLLARRLRRLRQGLGVLAFVSASAGSLAAAESDRRSAVDATCAWGRLADGRGKLVRCLSQEEATRLREAGAEPPPARATTEASKPPAPGSGEAPRAAPTPAPSVPVAEGAKSPPAAAAPAPLWPLPSAAKLVAQEPAAPAEPAPPSVEGSLAVEVGPVTADEGALPEALKSLKKAKDRLVECAEKNGGITGERGELELRFLVQARGRAEGVSIKKKRGLGDAAAKCIADVVDRRYVGYPEAPAVGATLVVTVAKKKK